MGSEEQERLRTKARARDLDSSALDSLQDSLLSSSLAPASVAQTQGAQHVERYVLLSLLGRGGMGEVWRVEDRDLGRTVALKLLRPELRMRPDSTERFIEEAQITAQLQHPGIVPVHEVGQLSDGRLFFTMKEVEGRTLSALIQEARSDAARWPTAARQLVGLLRRVCEAVAYAHARGVLHRDLKPSNIMVGAFGEVYVMDWGLARLAAATEPPLSVQSGHGAETRLGAVVGTPA